LACLLALQNIRNGFDPGRWWFYLVIEMGVDSIGRTIYTWTPLFMILGKKALAYPPEPLWKDGSRKNMEYQEYLFAF